MGIKLQQRNETPT